MFADPIVAEKASNAADTASLERLGNDDDESTYRKTITGHALGDGYMTLSIKKQVTGKNRKRRTVRLDNEVISTDGVVTTWSVYVVFDAPNNSGNDADFAGNVDRLAGFLLKTESGQSTSNAVRIATGIL